MPSPLMEFESSHRYYCAVIIDSDVVISAYNICTTFFVSHAPLPIMLTSRALIIELHLSLLLFMIDLCIIWLLF
ncbi:unnamed protein product [Amaranthus hypochondriacus]